MNAIGSLRRPGRRRALGARPGMPDDEVDALLLRSAEARGLDREPEELAASRRHLVLFVALGDPILPRLREAAPKDLFGLERAVVAADLGREREHVLARLRRAGVIAIDAPPEGLSVALLNRYLDIVRRERV